MKQSLRVVSLVLLFCLRLDQSHSRVAAETIECEYGGYRSIHVTESSLYYCKVKNFEIFATDERVHIDGVRGQHDAGKGVEQVQGVEISGVRGMGKFPTGLEMVFPNLIDIDVSFCRLREITSEDLRPFPHLKYLRLYNNWLTHLRENLFEHNRDLENFRVYDNRIVHIDRRTLSGLSKLRALKLEGNPCNLGVAYRRAGVEEIVARIEAGECQETKKDEE